MNKCLTGKKYKPETIW